MKIARLLTPLFVVLASAAAFTQSSPLIVAQASALAQEAGIPKTVLFNPTATGLYRVNAYLAAAENRTRGAWDLTVGWTDDSGRTYQTPDGWMELKIDYAQGGQVFRAVAGKPIQYFVSPFNRPNFAYNLFITVEQLEGDQ